MERYPHDKQRAIARDRARGIHYCIWPTCPGGPTPASEKPHVGCGQSARNWLKGDYEGWYEIQDVVDWAPGAFDFSRWPWRVDVEVRPYWLREGPDLRLAGIEVAYMTELKSVDTGAPTPFISLMHMHTLALRENAIWIRAATATLVHMALYKNITHEIDECFFVEGNRYREPHPRERGKAYIVFEGKP